MVWRGEACRGLAWHGRVYFIHGVARLGRVRQGEVWLGNVRSGRARLGEAWQGCFIRGRARHGKARSGWAWQGLF